MIGKRLLQALLFVIVLTTASLSHGITMNVSLSGDRVGVKMTATAWPSTTEGKFVVNFGDGSRKQSANLTFTGGPTSIVSPVTNTWTTTHTYTKGGNFLITGRWVSIALPNPDPPLTVKKGISIAEKKKPVPVTPEAPVATKQILILPEEPELVSAVIGEKYKALFSAKDGTRPYQFRRVSGILPPGIKLGSRGILEGIASKLGRYRFKVEVTDRRGQKDSRLYEITVIGGEANIRCFPARQQVSRQGLLSSVITYEYLGTAVQDRMYSSRGEFRVGGATIGTVNRGLTLNVKNGKARSSETVRVPESVIRRAEQGGSNRITYSRYFKSKSIVGKATSLLLLTAEGGEFRLTKMRIFFDNNRPRKVVARSSRGHSASVEINYLGTGLLKGYWEVDGRILQRVQKNVRFGKTITLTTPTVPPLPTYAEGPHRLRFVVTSPSRGIRYPVAFYDVTEQEKGRWRVVVLKGPEENTIIPQEGASFSWETSADTATYLVSFFDREAEDKEPVFTAYSETQDYALPSQAVKKFFTPGNSYVWLVVGFNKDGKIVSKSRTNAFSVKDSK